MYYVYVAGLIYTQIWLSTKEFRKKKLLGKKKNNEKTNRGI